MGEPEPTDRVPIPDPTRLTTEQLYREVGASRSVIEAGMRGKIEGVETRLLGEIRGLSEHVLGKISAITARLDSGDTALVAALMAAKEAGAVQNQFTTKAIDGQAGAFKASIDNLSTMLSDQRDRLTRIEGKTTGAGNTIGIAISIVAAGAAAIAAMAALGTHASSLPTPVVQTAPVSTIPFSMPK